MAELLLLSSALEADPVLPSLELLTHRVRRYPADPARVLNLPGTDLLMMDARTNLSAARALAKILTHAANDVPRLVITTEGGLSAISAEWEIDDVLLSTAGPAEVDARIRLAVGRSERGPDSTRVQTSGIVIDEASYTAKLRGKPLDLTFKEFQLLHFLAAHPRQVFTREQLLSEVWGYDYFGGTRTVDVHVRRLRAKLGDLEQLIGTVRNVGYLFTSAEDESESDR